MESFQRSILESLHQIVYGLSLLIKTSKNGSGPLNEAGLKKRPLLFNLKKTGKAFIVVGGQTYLIDPNTREQLNKTDITDTKTAITDEQEDYIYYSDGGNLHYMDCNGDSFVLFDNYHFDGIG